MSAGTAKEFENFARDCAQLAEKAATPELRERLIAMAREWMQAAANEEGRAASYLCVPRTSSGVPKVKPGNIGGEGRREWAER